MYLKHQVTIQQNSTATDHQGGTLEAWTNVVANIFADVVPLAAEHRYWSDGTQGIVTHSVFIRKRVGLQPGMRFVWRGKHLIMDGGYAVAADNDFDKWDCVERQV